MSGGLMSELKLNAYNTGILIVLVVPVILGLMLYTRMHENKE